MSQLRCSIRATLSTLNLNVNLNLRFGMVFYNNLLTTCILIPSAFLVGDFGILFRTPELHSIQYVSILLFSGEMALCVIFSVMSRVRTV